MKRLPLFAVLLFLLLAGCSSIETRAVVDLAKFKNVYVVHRLSDDHHIDELFVAELKRLGHDASCGPLTLLPDQADAILTYEDRWEWDFRSYLIELSFVVRTAHTDKKLADGRFYQPTPHAKPAAEVVRELLASDLKPK